jgi:hypothetical protein
MNNLNINNWLPSSDKEAAINSFINKTKKLNHREFNNLKKLLK